MTGVRKALLFTVSLLALAQTAKPSAKDSDGPDGQGQEATGDSFPEGHGIWVVVAHSCPYICAMDNAESDTWLGSKALISEIEIAFRGETCSHPTFARASYTLDEFFRRWRFDPGELGIEDSVVTEIRVSCEGRAWIAPGGIYILKSTDRLVTVWDGVFFELKREPGEP